MLYYNTLKKENLGDVNNNPIMRNVHRFLDKEYERWYSEPMSGKGWKFMYGINTKTEEPKETPLLLLLFADMLSHGNFVFTGIS